MDAARGEAILFQNAGYSHSEWAQQEADGDWISGQLAWPRYMPTDMAPFGASHARTVRQLTNYRAHSNHSYFTYPCWYDHGRKLVIASDQDNRVNLFGVDLESGALNQLTDWDPATKNRKV